MKLTSRELVSAFFDFYSEPTTKKLPKKSAYVHNARLAKPLTVKKAGK